MAIIACYGLLGFSHFEITATVLTSPWDSDNFRKHVSSSQLLSVLPTVTDQRVPHGFRLCMG